MRDPARTFYFGRTFVSPVFDGLTIAGGLTLPIALWLLWAGASAREVMLVSVPVLLLLVNQAHFAASSFRLYSKPGGFQTLPFLTMAFPLVTLVGVSTFVLFSNGIGHHLWALSLTWSPYHYAAQTFGLASMYCYRSGCRLSDGERVLLRWTCMVPFFRALVGSVTSGYGLGWALPAEWILADPAGTAVFSVLAQTLNVLTFAMPVLFFAVVARRSRRLAGGQDPGEARSPGVPLISMVVILANGSWFVFFEFMNAFVWATVFHGLQYLALVAVFHVRDRMSAPENRHGPMYHVVVLYAVCVAVGYGLFQCWPWAYMLAGFGMVESTLMVIAAINIHHFIVDAFIWRIRRDPNLATVMATSAS